MKYKAILKNATKSDKTSLIWTVNKEAFINFLDSELKSMTFDTLDYIEIYKDRDLLITIQVEDNKASSSNIELAINLLSK